MAGRMLMLAIVAGATGCVGKGTFGRDFDAPALQALPEGTAQSEVLAKYGEPQARRFEADGTEVWAYSFSRSTVNLASGVSDVNTKSAEVRFRDGKIVKPQPAAGATP